MRFVVRRLSLAISPASRETVSLIRLLSHGLDHAIGMSRRDHYLGRINSLQDVKRMAPFSVLALLGLARGALQSFEHVVLGDILDFWAAKQRIAIESLTEVCGQTILVGQESRLLALNHKVSVFVRGVVRLLPTVTLSQVKPRFRSVRNRAFAVNQQDDELLGSS